MRLGFPCLPLHGWMQNVPTLYLYCLLTGVGGKEVATSHCSLSNWNERVICDNVRSANGQGWIALRETLNKLSRQWKMRITPATKRRICCLPLCKWAAHLLKGPRRTTVTFNLAGYTTALFVETAEKKMFSVEIENRSHRCRLLGSKSTHWINYN